jgi:hypothetical protein
MLGFGGADHGSGFPVWPMLLTTSTHYSVQFAAEATDRTSAGAQDIGATILPKEWEGRGRRLASRRPWPGSHQSAPPGTVAGTGIDEA